MNSLNVLMFSKVFKMLLDRKCPNDQQSEKKLKIIVMAGISIIFAFEIEVLQISINIKCSFTDKKKNRQAIQKPVLKVKICF